jgi:hypothetical protein
MRTSPAWRAAHGNILRAQKCDAQSVFSAARFVHFHLISNAYSRGWFLDSPKPRQYGPRGFLGRQELRLF